jgi:hypothetical protein
MRAITRSWELYAGRDLLRVEPDTGTVYSPTLPSYSYLLPLRMSPRLKHGPLSSP